MSRHKMAAINGADHVSSWRFYQRGERQSVNMSTASIMNLTKGRLDVFQRERPLAWRVLRTGLENCVEQSRKLHPILAVIAINEI